MSNCLKCNGTQFTVVTQSPSGTEFKLNFVQCSSCGTPIGVLEFYNIGTILTEQEKLLTEMSSQLSMMENKLKNIETKVR
jgi:hypothetical protein